MWTNEDFPVVENVVESEAGSRLGRWPTAPQLKKLVLALYRGERLTPYRALQMCGTMRLSERMRELQALGWGIQKGWYRTETGANVREYWI